MRASSPRTFSGNLCSLRIQVGKIFPYNSILFVRVRNNSTEIPRRREKKSRDIAAKKLQRAITLKGGKCIKIFPSRELSRLVTRTFVTLDRSDREMNVSRNNLTRKFYTQYLEDERGIYNRG